MWRHIVLTGVALLSGGVLCAQMNQHIAVDNTSEFKKIKINYSVSSGNCYLSPAQKTNVLSVYGNKDIDDYNLTFNKNVDNKILFVELKIEDKTNESFSQSISSRVFNKPRSVEETTWKVYLNEDKPYILDLSYGIGEAYIDLSGLTIENLHVNTGSANVKVGYLSEIANQTDMDTFDIKVDLGSLQMRKMNMAHSKYIKADVGFGNAFIDFSDPPSNSSYIAASIGVGNLELLIPNDKDGTGIKMIIHESVLSQIKMAKSFSQIEPNIYINNSYEEGADDQLIFDIDVSLGNVLVKEKK